jgi:hypothetical protein
MAGNDFCFIKRNYPLIDPSLAAFPNPFSDEVNVQFVA